MKNIDYDEVIRRVGFFRNRSKLSMRETSKQLGLNKQFMTTIESKSIELKVSTLLDFCDVVGITIQDFFYLGEKYNEKDKNILELFANLTDENKNVVIDLMKRLK